MRVAVSLWPFPQSELRHIHGHAVTPFSHCERESRAYDAQRLLAAYCYRARGLSDVLNHGQLGMVRSGKMCGGMSLHFQLPL